MSTYFELDLILRGNSSAKAFPESNLLFDLALHMLMYYQSLCFKCLGEKKQLY